MGRIFIFEELDVYFCGLEAFSLVWKFSMEA
jgi:hypothetical protein